MNTNIAKSAVLLLVLLAIVRVAAADDASANEENGESAPFEAQFTDGSTLDVHEYKTVGKQVYLLLPDGRMVAFGKEELIIWRREVRDGQPILTLVGEEQKVQRPGHTPDRLSDYARHVDLPDSAEGGAGGEGTPHISIIREKTPGVSESRGSGSLTDPVPKDQAHENYKEMIEWGQRMNESFMILQTLRRGDPSKRGGSATVRKSYPVLPDNPLTTNDESNDQPLGFFGTMTLHARNLATNGDFVFDADVVGFSVERIYFVKGGWVDFFSCDLDADYFGLCIDENGNHWSFLGECLFCR